MSADGRQPHILVVNDTQEILDRRGYRRGRCAVGEAAHLVVRLLPDGRVAVPGSAPEADAVWQLLGYTHHAGARMGFVRAELAGASWTALVEPAWLERPKREARVTLARQGDAQREPLVGWILFC
jgi:hypothetical protein